MHATPAVDLLERSPFVPLVDAAALADDQLLAEIRAGEAVRKQLDAHQTRLLGEVDARGTTDIVDGHRTKEWLVTKANIASSTAAAQLKVARRLRSDLPETAAALAEGRISFDHAKALAYASNPRVAEDLAGIEAKLIEDAAVTPFSEWKSQLAMIVALFDQDGAYDPDADLERNVLSMAVVGDELLIKATLIGDTRVIVEQTIDLFADRLFRRYRDDKELTGVDIPPRTVLQAMALLEICRRARAVDLNSTRPAEPEVRVIISGDQLDGDAPHVSDVEGRPVQNPGEPANSILTLACAANLKAVIVDSLGQPIDHGRQIRNFTAEQKKLMADRDGGCTFPGCCMPAAWTDGHHIDHWVRDQGRTDLDKGVSECRHHHRVVHRKGWSVELVDGWALYTKPDGTRFWGQRHRRIRDDPPPPPPA